VEVLLAKQVFSRRSPSKVRPTQVLVPEVLVLVLGLVGLVGLVLVPVLVLVPDLVLTMFQTFPSMPVVLNRILLA